MAGKKVIRLGRTYSTATRTQTRTVVYKSAARSAASLGVVSLEMVLFVC